MNLRVLSYNIRYGGNGRERQLAEVIRACEPEVVVLQEATDPLVVERLAAELKMERWGSIRGHSLAFLSRVRIAHHAWRRVRLARRRYLELEPEGAEFRIYGVHLSAIHSNITELRRAYELRAILRNIKAHQKGLHVVTGDFNTLAPGEQLDMGKLPPRLRAFLWITGRNILWQTIQLMLDAGYIDGYRTLKPGHPGSTFPTWDPHIRLDYVFVPTTSAACLTTCEVMKDVPGVRDASDHFPLMFEIDTSAV